MSNQLAKVSDATKATGVSSSLNPNKCITLSEMEDLLKSAPQKAVTSESYHNMIYNLIAASSTSNASERLAFVQNLNGKKAQVRSGYGQIDLGDGSYGGWYSIPNASGWDSVYVTAYDKAITATVVMMKKTGAYTYTKVVEKTINVSANGTSEVRDDSYQLSGAGHIYYVLLT